MYRHHATFPQSPCEDKGIFIVVGRALFVPLMAVLILCYEPLSQLYPPRNNL